MNSSDYTEVRLARELLDSLLSRNNAHVIYPFMDEIDPDALGLKGYRTIVTEPMWLNKISQSFAEGAYRNIREFVCDFRLMLLNCYRYNGVSSRMGRMAEKLELLFEQKLQLLSPEIRAKASIQSTLGSDPTEEENIESADLPRRRSSSRLFMSGDSRHLTPVRAIVEELEHALQPDGSGVTASLLLTALPTSLYTDSTTINGPNTISTSTADERARLLVTRLSQWRVRRQDESLLHSWHDWWAERHGPQSIDLMKRTPELLEIYQFLWLADPFLGITDCLSHSVHIKPDQGIRLPPASLELYDLELALAAAPQSSQLLAACMTNLLATPKERNQIVSALTSRVDSADETGQVASGQRCPKQRRQKQRDTADPLTPLAYDTWERRLAQLVSSWYRLLWDKGKGSVIWAVRRLGLSSEFFERCGIRTSPLDRMRFHELPVYIRVQLFHALCESVMRTFENLRLSMDHEADWDASRPVPLGVDRLSGVAYVHYPGMLDSEAAVSCRVYRIPRFRNKPVPIIGEQPSFQEAKEMEVPVQSTPPVSAALDLAENSPVSPTDGSCENPRRRTKARRRSTKMSLASGSKKPSAIAEHDRSLSDFGLCVPGPVGRLPCWLPPALSRSVCRRWYKIAERLHFESLSAGPQGSKPSSNRKTTQQSITLPRLSWFEQFLVQHNGVNVKKLPTKPVANKIPFPNFQSADNQMLRDLINADPLLQPSPHGLLNGCDRRYISMRMARGYPGSFRSQTKSNRRTARKTEKPFGSTGTRTNAESNDAASSPTVSQSDANGDSPSSAEEEDDDEEEREQEQEDDETRDKIAEENADQPAGDENEKANWLNDLGSETASGSSPQDNSSTQQNVKPSSIAPEPSEAEPLAEPLVTEPVDVTFSLIADNTDSLCDLIRDLKCSLDQIQHPPGSHMTQEPVVNQSPASESAYSSDSASDSSWSSCDELKKQQHTEQAPLSPMDVSNGRHSCTEKCARRRKRVSRELQKLIANLERLVPLARDRQPQREEAQQLARLRIRKEAALWLTKTDTKKNEQPSPKKQMEVVGSSEKPQSDLANERARRQKRRERLRLADQMDDSLSDGDNNEPNESASSPTLSIQSTSQPNTTSKAIENPVDKSPALSALPAWKPTVHSVSHSVVVPASSAFQHSSSTSPYTLNSVSRPRTNPVVISSTQASSSVFRSPSVSPLRPVFPLVGSQCNGPRPSVPTQIPSVPQPPAPGARRIYRVYETLFTEDARPVRIDSNGALQPLPLDSVPLDHRLVAVRMIEKYKNLSRSTAAAAAAVVASTPSSVPALSQPKRVAVKMGEPDQC